MSIICAVTRTRWLLFANAALGRETMPDGVAGAAGRAGRFSARLSARIERKSERYAGAQLVHGSPLTNA